MANTHASGGQVPDGTDAMGDGGSVHDDSSSRLERFGLGVSVSILLGGIVGVAATSVLADDGTALLIALGLGFLLSPVMGLAAVMRIK